MKKRHMTILAAAMTAACIFPVYAEDNPDEVLKAASAVSDGVMDEKAFQSSVEDRWQAFLSSQPWKLQSTDIDEGVLVDEGRELIISSAIVQVQVGLGQPGWIESRLAAFQMAELEAKSGIIKRIAQGVEGGRGYSMFENVGFSDGDVSDIKQVGEVSETMKKIGKKSLALTDATLDAALKKLDPDYDPADFEKMTSEKKKIVVEQKIAERSKIWAMKSISGVTPIYATEGESEGGYQILVAVAYSPKLHRLARSLQNGEYNIPSTDAYKPLNEQIPQDKNLLLGTMGTRMMIDEKGHYAIVSFSQAQPRPSAPNRRLDAIQTAKKIAAHRASTQITYFVEEALSIESNLDSEELSRGYDDLSSGVENQRKFVDKVKGRKSKVKLSGLYTLKKWSTTHPLTGQKVAGAIVAWSPSSAQLSKKMDAALKEQSKRTNVPVVEESALDKNAVIEAMPIQGSVY